MKLRKNWIAALAVTLVATTAGSAYAASPELRDTIGNLIADVQIYTEGEMPAIPDGAIRMEAKVIVE